MAEEAVYKRRKQVDLSSMDAAIIIKECLSEDFTDARNTWEGQHPETKVVIPVQQLMDLVAQCPAWVKMVGFPRTWKHFLPLLAAQLGKVICPPNLDTNSNRFCVLWDTDKPTPSGITVDSGDPMSECQESLFKLQLSAVPTAGTRLASPPSSFVRPKMGDSNGNMQAKQGKHSVKSLATLQPAAKADTKGKAKLADSTDGVLMLVRHVLQPVLADNDQAGRWMVVQCLVQGNILEFAGALDLWAGTRSSERGYTFAHYARSEYRARLDRWYVLGSQQHEILACDMRIDHTFTLSDHFLLWLFIHNETLDAISPLPNKQLLHINNAYLSHKSFQNLIKAVIPPLLSHMFINVDVAWYCFVMRIQAVIKDYGSWYMHRLRDKVQKDRMTIQALESLADTRRLTHSEQDELCTAKAALTLNNRRNIEK
ncbi:hypothetical protein L7F22_011256 [Adiantum nelumboides]|nr:hypothetical protein [Adiantum nelumboides]